MGLSKALANLKCANLSASFGARRMAGNDIGIGPVLATGCSPAPDVASEITEAITFVCERYAKVFDEVGTRGRIQDGGSADLGAYCSQFDFGLGSDAGQSLHARTPLRDIKSSAARRERGDSRAQEGIYSKQRTTRRSTWN